MAITQRPLYGNTTSRNIQRWQSHSGHCMAIPRAETHRDGNHTAAIVWQYHEQKHTDGNHTAAIVWQYHEQKHTQMAITQRPLYGNTTSRNTQRWQSHSGHCMAIPRAETHRDGNHTAAIVWQYHEQKHTETAITQRPLYGNTTSRNTQRRQSHSGHCMAIPRAETHRDGNHTAAIVWQYHEQKHTEMAITQRPLYGNTTSRNTQRWQSHSGHCMAIPRAETH